MTSKRVGILMGGTSAEREISLHTGQAVHRALRQRGYDVRTFDVADDLPGLVQHGGAIDVAFLALHGSHGEDGCIQGLLETLGIPYTGSDVLSSALSMDKSKAKELFRLYNVPTPPYYTLTQAELPELEAIHGSFGFPAFVKPTRSGSSFGAGRADDLASLRARCEEAARYDSSVLVERFIAGREVAVGLLDGQALGAVEIAPRGSFYDYRSKYEAGQSDYHLPPRLSPARYQGVLNLAERAHRGVGACGATRVDVLVTEGENEYVLEVNTVPGLTPTSLLPKVAAHAGYSFGDLCEAILDRAQLHVTGGHRPAAGLARSAYARTA
jgi:D-alanine-D-alanine ligase